MDNQSKGKALTDEQIEAALNACTFGQTKETRCKNCPLDSDKEPCITNLHLAALEYIGRLKHRAEVAEKALDLCETAYILSLNHRATEGVSGQAIASDLGVHKFFIEQAEKELAEEGKDD